MSGIQKFFRAIMPASWFAAAEAESKTWFLHCAKCGHDQSIWDSGGIRWHASGHSWTRWKCEKCHVTSWQSVIRKQGDLHTGRV